METLLPCILQMMALNSKTAGSDSEIWGCGLCPIKTRVTPSLRGPSVCCFNNPSLFSRSYFSELLIPR